MKDEVEREFPRRETAGERLKTSPRLGGSGAGPGWLMGGGSRSVAHEPGGSGSGKLLLPPPGSDVPKPSFAVAVLAGGFASATVDVTIFPLDSLKTRLQAPQGFQRAGGTTGLFRGVLAAAVGAVPGGAVFFGAYEYTRHVAQGGAASPHWTTDAVAATLAATASCLVRNPAVVVTQRMQVGQYSTLPAAVATMWRTEGAMGFYAGLQVSVLRELPFAFIQFPLYEGLKRVLRRSQQHDITASQGAVCGSISGAVAAAATTPLDLMKTRVMLGGADGSALGVLSAMARVRREEGALALFRGLGPRVGWMTLGGYIFFGAYEQCLRALTLMGRRDARDARDAKDAKDARRDGTPPPPPFPPPPARDARGAPAAATTQPAALVAPAASLPPASSAIAERESATAAAGGSDVVGTSSDTADAAVAVEVALLSGAAAGISIDLVLFPLDTLKTRAIQGLELPGLHAFLSGSSGPLYQDKAGHSHRPPLSHRLAAFARLWRGISAAVVPAVPAAASFFATYEAIKGDALARRALGDGAALSSVAALVAEAVSCVVRVPAEQLKMRLQATHDATFAAAVRAVRAQGGWGALYKGLGATLMLDLPFALIQFPLFEGLKAGLARRRLAADPTASAAPTPTEGAAAGGMAGAFAAMVTTPLDVIRTRHVLSAERRHVLATVRAVHAADGLHGFCRGMLPRTLYMGAGGVVYLGMYTPPTPHSPAAFRSPRATLNPSRPPDPFRPRHIPYPTTPIFLTTRRYTVCTTQMTRLLAG